MKHKGKLMVLLLGCIFILIGCQKGEKRKDLGNLEQTKSETSSEAKEGNVDMTNSQGFMLVDGWAIVKLADRQENILVKLKTTESLPNEGESFSFTYEEDEAKDEGALKVLTWEKTKDPEVLSLPINEGVQMAWQFADSLIDVRTEEEFREGYIPEARNIPLDTLDSNLSQVDKTKPVFVYCRSGARSEMAAQFFFANGYKMVINIGGILDYSNEIIR